MVIAKSVLVSSAVTAILYIAMATYCAPLHPAVPALQFTYTESSFKAITSAWGEGGIKRFKVQFLFDFPFLIGYGIWGFVLSTRTSLFAHRSRAMRTALTWCLPLAAAADATENLLHLYLVSGNGPFPAALYLVAGTVATGKWLLDAIFAGHVAFSAYASLTDRK